MGDGVEPSGGEAAGVELAGDGERPVLVLRGDLDLHAADKIRERGFAALDDLGRGALTVDLGAVEFVDSSVLGALVEVRAYALDVGRSLVLSRVSDRVKRVMTMAGLDSVFAFEVQR